MGESYPFKEYVAGLLAGVATVLIGHPFDTVKVNITTFSSLSHIPNGSFLSDSDVSHC